MEIELAVYKRNTREIQDDEEEDYYYEEEKEGDEENLLHSVKDIFLPHINNNEKDDNDTTDNTTFTINNFKKNYYDNKLKELEEGLFIDDFISKAQQKRLR